MPAPAPLHRLPAHQGLEGVPTTPTATPRRSRSWKGRLQTPTGFEPADEDGQGPPGPHQSSRGGPSARRLQWTALPRRRSLPGPRDPGPQTIDLLASVIPPGFPCTPGRRVKGAAGSGSCGSGLWRRQSPGRCRPSPATTRQPPQRRGFPARRTARRSSLATAFSAAAGACSASAVRYLMAGGAAADVQVHRLGPAAINRHRSRDALVRLPELLSPPPHNRLPLPPRTDASSWWAAPGWCNGSHSHSAFFSAWALLG